METLPDIDKKTLNEMKWEFVSEVLHRDLDQLDGVDAPKGIFPNERQFEIILERAKYYGTGFLGIEPEKDGEFFDVRVYEEYKIYGPTAPEWFMDAFKQMKGEPDLEFSATYHVPDHVAAIYYYAKMAGKNEK